MEDYNDMAAYVEMCTDYKRIDYMPAQAAAGGAEKISIVPYIAPALLSALRVEQDTGKKAVTVIQLKNRTAAQKEQKGCLKQFYPVFFHAG